MLGDAYASFFAIPGARVAFMGIWALVFVTLAPFAWGWDDDAYWGEGAPKFDFGWLALGLSFPLWPLLIGALPLALLALFLVGPVPDYLARWWNSDWSAR